MHVTVNNDFKVVYNLKFQKQYSSTKSNYQSRQVTGCSQCSSIIFVIALALWMYDHAFIVQKLLRILIGRMTHMAKTTQLNTGDIVIRAGRTPSTLYQIMLHPSLQQYVVSFARHVL